MRFMMMWTPFHYWNAMFAWQKNITDLMDTWVKPQEKKAVIAESQTSPLDAPASSPVTDVSEIPAEAKERRTEQSPAKLGKPLSPRRPSSKEIKQSQKNGSAKVAHLKGRRAPHARA
jgi:hypothetical protein